MATADETSSFTGADTSEDEVIESLVAGRQKRSTAGRNMSSLLDAAADDDLTLLFAEDENDDEFDQDEGADGDVDDMRLDSSSEDEDDQGSGAADELEGEIELEKQARVERKKRKAQESLRLTALRKKVKIDSAAMPKIPSATPRPKKKSERVSWLPTPEEGPVRSSSRRQTMQNKELTHARLKDSEQRRIKLIATMEEAAKRKQRMKPKVMTQEERLAEAEKIERLNSKSLNRWEEMEKRKAEERKAKLEALQNRRLEGPVMSWWSGIAKWANGKLIRVGNVEVKPKVEKEEPERKRKGSKDTAVQDTAVKLEMKGDEPSVPATVGDTPSLPIGVPPIQDSTASTTTSAENTTIQQNENPSQAQQDEKTTSPQGFLEGIHQYASLPVTPAQEQTEPEVNVNPESEVAKPESTLVTDNAEEQSQADELKNGEDGKKDDGNNDNDLNNRQEDMPKDDDVVIDGKVEETRMDDAPAAETDQVENSKDALDTQGHPLAHKPTDGTPQQEAQSLQDATQTGPNQERAVKSAEATETEKGNVEDESIANKAESTEPATANSTVPSAEQQEQQVEQAAIAVQDAAPAPVLDTTTAPTSEMEIDQPDSTAVPMSTNEAEAAFRPEDIEQTGRNLVVLENFDNTTMQDHEYSIYFNAKRPPRLTKIASHLCPITSQLSRYRDPDTGLPFANVVGYQEIRNLTEQKYIWSGMLGCYIGSATVAAKGVPAQFLTGVKAEKTAKEENPTGSDRDKDATNDAMEVDKS